MVGRYPDEAGADELRKLAERFLAIIQAQQMEENDQKTHGVLQTS